MEKEMMIAPIFRASPERVVEPMMIPAAAQAVESKCSDLLQNADEIDQDMRDSFRTKDGEMRGWPRKRQRKSVTAYEQPNQTMTGIRRNHCLRAFTPGSCAWELPRPFAPTKSIMKKIEK
jgi:hypothetical protein